MTEASRRAGPAAFLAAWSGAGRAVLARPGVRRGLKWAGVALLVVYFLFVVAVLVLRHVVLPQVAGHQAEIERAAAAAIGLPVRLERIEADMQGVNPRLVLSGVRIADRQGLPALAFERVEAVMSWHSVWRLKPILALLAVDGPVLNIRRDAAGRIAIAGFEAEEGGAEDPRLARWFFQQRRIRISNATIVWEDARRQAPQLVLEDLQFRIENRGSRHRFGLSALPPKGLASRLDIRGELRGDPTEGIEALSGQIFAQLDYADLAGWRTWVDYPVLLQQGRGAVRVWGEWKRDRGGVTADLALEDVRVKLGREVPQLDLSSMRGRVEGRYRKDAWQIGGSRVELSTLDGLRVPPTDFQLEWRRSGEDIGGSATANFLDLAVLERLAAHLPLDARSRELLKVHQPRGRITDLRAAWESEGRERLRHYSVHARFDRLGMRAAGYFPGGEGLSGELEASEKSGSLQIDSKDAALDLPSVFPESRIPLSSLKAKADWKIDGKRLDARLERIDFAGPDAAGAARGTYRYEGDGPGTIDLTAELSRAEGKSIWRYMPHVVNEDTRTWLKRGITTGAASDGKLVLKGDLRHFPFVDKRHGEFRITAKAKGVHIDYAPGWPAVEGVEADMEFGVGMRVLARQGAILGTRITAATAEIPSFDAPQGEMLLVNGNLEGPTAEFLRFIDKSPVAEKINRMTEDMRAAGNGNLALKLEIPLRNAVDAHVEGEYQFVNNQVTAVPALPPVNKVNGRLLFTEETVSSPEITGEVLGAPMRLTVRDDKERIVIALAGGAVARELRKAYDTPLFDHLSGSTTWKGEVRVRRSGTDFTVESSLQGLSSSLPAPLNKTAAATLPVRFEKAPVAGDKVVRDQIRVSVGEVARALVLRRHDGADAVVERGAISVGVPLPALPPAGVAAAVTVARLDGDFWRRLLPANDGEKNAGGSAAGGGGTGASALPLASVTVRTPSLRLYGRDFNDVQLGVTPRDEGWQIAINAREAAGDVFWQGSGKGTIRADFKRLVVPAEGTPADAGPGGGNGGSELVENLPGLDVRAADFTLGNKRLGRLEAKAHNAGGAWHLDSLLLQNPDGSLRGKGLWRTRGGHRTQLEFDLAASDVGKLLERLGYPGAVKRGAASMRGDLAWDGPLTSIHYPSLTGDFRLSAQKGQFAKIEPGLGKLLGLISLQSLPRRLTLDFRDIFSEGFAFDSIDGRMLVQKGILRTDDFRIAGPSARILMKGEADLRQETQDLAVTVQPEVGGLAAVGAIALANPVAGAAAYVANKILQNPLDRMFAFHYRITGTWSDPKVEKLGMQTPTPLGDGGPSLRAPTEGR